MLVNTALPPATRRDRLEAIAVTALVAVCVVAVNGRVLGYPFIQDDWYYIHEILRDGPGSVLADYFSPYRQELYRPFDTLYFVFVVQVLGLNPLLTHVIALVSHTAASLLVVAILSRLTGDTLVGRLGGILYGSAVFVHMDPLLWASGIAENASALLILSSVFLFLTQRYRTSVAAYAAALLFKESAIFLPLVFGALLWCTPADGLDRGAHISPRPGRFGAHIGLVTALYSVAKIAGKSPLFLPDDHPYALRLLGPHVLRNVGRYAEWSFRSLFPEWQPGILTVALLLAAVLASIAGSTWRLRQCERAAVGARVLGIWLCGAVAVYFFLPNHVYRYYLTAALPAFLGLILLAIRAVCVLCRIRVRAANLLMVLLTVASVTSSFLYFRAIDQRGWNQPSIIGTNNLVQRGSTVRAVEKGLLMAHPRLAPHTVLVFKGVDLAAFDQHSGPRLWYSDATLRAYDVDELIEDHGDWFLRSTPIRQHDEHAEVAPQLVARGCQRLRFFEMTEKGLIARECPSSSLKEGK